MIKLHSSDCLRQRHDFSTTRSNATKVGPATTLLFYPQSCSPEVSRLMSCEASDGGGLNEVEDTVETASRVAGVGATVGRVARDAAMMVGSEATARRVVMVEARNTDGGGGTAAMVGPEAMMVEATAAAGAAGAVAMAMVDAPKADDSLPCLPTGVVVALSRPVCLVGRSIGRRVGAGGADAPRGRRAFSLESRLNLAGEHTSPPLPRHHTPQVMFMEPWVICNQKATSTRETHK